MIDMIQRGMRTGLIGGSDAAAACGVDPYRTPYDLWAEKTGRVKRNDQNRFTEAGTFLEGGVLDWFEQQINRPLSRDVMLASADDIRVANLDAMIPDNGVEIVEVKTSGLFGGGAPSWGKSDDGVDAVPEHVLVQVAHGMSVADETYGRVRVAHVAALLGGRGFQHYVIERNDMLVDAVAEQVRRFHRDHIQTDTPPANSYPSLEVARQLHREPGKKVAIDPDLVARWRNAVRALDKAGKDEAQAKSLVIAALGDAEVGTCPLGDVTYYEQHRKGYTVADTSFRVCRFRQARGAK